MIALGFKSVGTFLAGIQIIQICHQGTSQFRHRGFREGERVIESLLGVREKRPKVRREHIEILPSLNMVESPRARNRLEISVKSNVWRLHRGRFPASL